MSKLLDEIKINATGLKTDWSLIRAGGPGSGRHDEGKGGAKLSLMHHTLNKMGFEQHKVHGMGMNNTYHVKPLSSPYSMEPEHSVSVHPNGDWSHFESHNDESMHERGHGNGHESMISHLGSRGVK
jgi:hypothetical protein